MGTKEVSSWVPRTISVKTKGEVPDDVVNDFEQLLDMYRTNRMDEETYSTADFKTKVNHLYNKYGLDYPVQLYLVLIDENGHVKTKLLQFEELVGKEEFIELLTHNFIEENSTIIGSDKEEVNIYKHLANITAYIKPVINGGAMFRGKYIGPENIIREFESLQMFGEYEVHCLVYALEEQARRNNYKIDCLWLNDYLLMNKYPSSQLGEVCSRMSIQIELTYFNGRRVDKQKYGNFGDMYHLGLFKGHYFSNHMIKIPAYGLKNYLSIGEGWEQVTSKNSKGTYIKGNIKDITAYDFLKFVSNNNWIQSNLLLPWKSRKITLAVLDNEDMSYTKVSELEKEYKNEMEFLVATKYTDLVFADIECVSDNVHIPVCIVAYSQLRKMKTYVGLKCIDAFLNDLSSGSVVYFHNLKYDFTIITPYVTILDDSVQKNNQIYSMVCSYNKKKFEFRDSYKTIPMPLRDFAKSFGLKETKGSCDFEKLNELYHAGQLFDSDFFKDVVKYCELDVQVLRNGFIKFNKILYEATGICVYRKLSISGIAHSYLIKQGAYDGCVYMEKTLLSFIQRTVVGGRVCSRYNKPYHIKNSIDLLDAKSLYPSAIIRLAGIPKGIPKALGFDKCKYFLKMYYGCNFPTNWVTCDQIKLKEHTDYSYFIKFKVKEIGERLPISTFCTKINGLNEWGYAEIGQIMFMDMFTFEETIVRHKMKVIALEILYFDEVNPVSKTLVQRAFDQRKEASDSGNEGLSTVWKLLLNSMYGKSIISPSTERITYGKFTDTESIADYMALNAGQIFSTEVMCNGQTKIKTKYYDLKHRNTNYWGSLILGMSKRIMNEVINLPCAPVVYSGDTDSIHVLKSMVETMVKEYKEIYDRDLIGNQLGQFHSDFENKWEEDGVVYKSESQVGIEEVYFEPKCFCFWVEQTM